LARRLWSQAKETWHMIAEAMSARWHVKRWETVSVAFAWVRALSYGSGEWRRWGLGRLEERSKRVVPRVKNQITNENFISILCLSSEPSFTGRAEENHFTKCFAQVPRIARPHDKGQA
jgi:hypothetical protein